jgi:signal transduction histidine kinase
MKLIYCSVLIILSVFFISCDNSTEPTEPEPEIYPDLSVYEFSATKNLVKYVCDAGELLKEKGNAALPLFDGEPWLNGSDYVFVYTLDGVLLYNPSDDENIGNNRIDMLDIWGKPIIREMIDVITNPEGNGSGWVHYQWHLPKWDDITWKTSFVKKIEGNDGVEYLIGSGNYDMPNEKIFIKDRVLSASELIESNGESSFNTIRDSTGIYIFKKTYIFVSDSDGNMLVHPLFPALEGTNMMDDKDINGKLFMKEIIDSAVNDGEGWVTYMWPPAEYLPPAEKHTFVKKAVYNGKTYIVGSGMFYD